MFNTRVTSNFKLSKHRILTCFFNLILLTLILSSCQNKHSVEGIWYSTHYQVGDEERQEENTIILDFKDGNLFTVTFRDLASGNYDSMWVDSTSYIETDNLVYLYGDSITVRMLGDSVLVLESLPYNLFFQRVPNNIRHFTFTEKDLLGGAVLESKDRQDTLDFINDSTLLHTGEYHYPVENWSLQRYKGITFLNVKSVYTPVFVVNSKTDNGVGLLWGHGNELFLRPLPTLNKNFKEPLYGIWKETNSTKIKGPPPPNMTEEDQIMVFEIREDSVELYQYQQRRVMSWLISSDGKRIYFPERLKKWDGTWQVLNVSDSTLELSIPQKSLDDLGPTKFQKMETH